MTIYLLRHGVAEDVSPDGTDRARRLTPEGLRLVKQAAAGMHAAGLFPDRIVSSPYPRALATAEAVGGAFGLEVTTDERLGSGARPDAFLAVLAELDGAKAPVLVGHQPDLGACIAALTGQRVGVPKGALAVLAVTEPVPGGGGFTKLLRAETLASFADD